VCGSGCVVGVGLAISVSVRGVCGLSGGCLFLSVWGSVGLFVQAMWCPQCCVLAHWATI
jgi:hypothetical protein